MNMFKKTLLAVALSTATLAANAASVIGTSVTAAGTPISISSQGLPATKAVTIAIGDGTLTAVELEALSGAAGTTTEYIKVSLKAADDTAIVTGARLVVSVTGAFFANPGTAIAGIADGDMTGTDVGIADGETIAINGTDSTSTKLVFDLAGTGFGVADGSQIRIGNVALITTGSAVSFSSVFETNSKVAVASTAAAVKVVATITDQWKAGLTGNLAADPVVASKLDAQIDVGDSRLTFVGGVTSDVLLFDADTISSTVTATATGATLKLKGDFTGVKSVTAVTGADAAVTYAIDTGKTEATFTYTTTSATTAIEALSSLTTYTVALNTVTADKVSLDVRDFTFDADVAYTDAESTPGTLELLGNVGAGSFTLNGVTDTTNYVPFGPNTAVIYQATSTFSEDASLSVSYLNPTTGKMVPLNDIATVTANSVSRLGPTIAAAIIADSGLESGKTRMVVTVNAPTGKVTFFKGFKDTSDKDRLGL
jgi:hypothetical protein